ncbi:hypothetical protein ACFPPD_10870 [Cohnella suwonensis]|uniref:Uncharacterized protein n=1 Tax=Cohnella suwonensis TaxID=696072 RepID=A0ABW0LWK3_9BACL
MTLKKKAVLSTLALSMLATSIGGIPLSRQGLAEKLGLSGIAYAAESITEPSPEVTPEPSPEATPEPSPEATPEPSPEATPEPPPEVTPEPSPVVTPEPPPEVTPEPSPEVTPEPSPEVTPEPSTEVTPEPSPEATPEPEPEQAEEAGVPSVAFLGKWNAIYAALAAGDPADLRDVTNLQLEIASLGDADARLIDPIWNKIAAKLPPTADKPAMRASLFRLFKAVGSAPYDPQGAALEAIRTDPEYRSTLKAIAEAAGVRGIAMQDLLVFLFGDGAGLKGVEGTVSDLLAGKSAFELVKLLGDKQGITALLLQAMGQLLGDTGSYKFNAVLANLGVTPQDVQTTVFGFLGRLQKDEPAINAMTIAYLRASATASVEVGGDGRKRTYRLSVFGIEIPSLALQWTKVSGDPEVSVATDGTVTIPPETDEGTAVVRASLYNPYGGSAKVLFEQSISLKADDGERTVFPIAPFLERVGRIHAALLAGSPAGAEAVRAVREEIAAIDAETGAALVGPLWKAIEPKLPASVDRAKAQQTLLGFVRAVALLSYDPQASELEALLADPDIKALLKAVGVAGGVNNLAPDDLLVFLFGDGDALGGVEGAVRGTIAAMSPEELARWLGSGRAEELALQATGGLLANTEQYKWSSALKGLGIAPRALLETSLAFQAHLANDEAAGRALTVAFVRSETESTTETSEDGLTQRFGLKAFGVELPASVLRWTKVSGSADVKVEPNGVVTIPRRVETATAVIQAALVNPDTGTGTVLFSREVTLKSAGGEVFPIEAYLAGKAKLWAALRAGDSSDEKTVVKLRDEIAGLDVATGLRLIDPIWNKIADKLPKESDSASLRTSLFKLVRDVSKLKYDPYSTASGLEALLDDEEYGKLLEEIAAAGGANSLTTDDVLVFLYGDGEERGGVEGAVRALMSKQKPKDLAGLVGDAGDRTAILNEAMANVLADRESYGLSDVLGRIGVNASDLRSTVSNWQSKLSNEEKADNAMTVALFRSEAVPAAKVSKQGRRQDYSLSVFGVQLPSSSLKWSKVSGSKDVKVGSGGTVTLTGKAVKGIAVIQADIDGPRGASSVVFRQEITIGVEGEDIDLILDELEEKLDAIEEKLKKTPDTLAKLALIVEVISAGNDATKRINDSDAEKADKQKAIKESKEQVKDTINAIIRNVLGF